MSKKILVTGGAGFIGSHTCIELLNNGNEVVIVDNLYNANKNSLEVVEKVTGKKVTFYEVDIRDEEKLNEVFETEKDIFGVIHFAGLKVVGESCALPLKYYDNNVAGTTTLCRVMEKIIVKVLFLVHQLLYMEIHMLFQLKKTSHYQ